MSSLIDCFKNLFFRSNKFKLLEREILDSIRGKLHSPQIELWDSQVKSINKIYRSPDGMEVYFYVIKNGVSDFPRVLCFVNDEEFKIAVVDIFDNDAKIKLRARVWCAGGHIFSIAYKKSFKDFEKISQGNWCISCHIVDYPN